MPYRKSILFVSALAAVVLLTAGLASALRKPKTKLITIRGPEGQFVIGTEPCGSKTCIKYSGSETDVDIAGFGRHASLTWKINQGDSVFTTPSGGTSYEADGDAQITLNDGSILNMEFGGPALLAVNLTTELAFAKFAAALSGTGRFADASGVADATIILNLITDQVEWELDGNYTN